MDAVPEAGTANLTVANINKLKVAELQEELDALLDARGLARGLETGGLKQALRDRLIGHLRLD